MITKSLKRTFVCIASGPSLTKGQVNFVEQIKDYVTVICVNDNYRIAPWADHTYAADPQWWNMYIRNFRKVFQGNGWCQDKNACDRLGLSHIKGRYKPGLGKKDIIHFGHNSGYQAINLAYLMGAKKIILLGYDMGAPHQSGKKHWFGNHPQGLRNNGNYAKWVQHFTPLANDLRAEKVDVINCTPSTNITQFRRSTIEKEVRLIQKEIVDKQITI